jgi:molybdenum cofactor cytidylyltransferase
VVLAAGASRRFGTPKQLFPWRGRSFLELALWHADQTLPGRVVVVTGAYTERLDGIIGASGAIQVHNPGWNEGMASSIRAGVAALPADCAAALLMPCDQPLVDADDLMRLVSVWDGAQEQAVASGYAGTFGIPAVIPARLFPALAELRGDRGARSLLEREARSLQVCEIPAGHLDIDQDADAESLGLVSRARPPGQH